MNRIRELRESEGMNQKQLGDALGASQNAVSNWERGIREPDVTTLSAIADYFKVSLDYLLGRTDDRDGTADMDDDIWALREQLRRKPGMRILFSATKDATEDDLMRAVRIIEALKEDSGHVD